MKSIHYFLYSHHNRIKIGEPYPFQQTVKYYLDKFEINEQKIQDFIKPEIESDEEEEEEEDDEDDEDQENNKKKKKNKQKKSSLLIYSIICLRKLVMEIGQFNNEIGPMYKLRTCEFLFI